MTATHLFRTILLLLTLGNADLEQVYQLATVRWLPLLLDLIVIDVIAQVAKLVRVVPQVIEPELVVCPDCHGTGRNPEAPDAIADDDGTCLTCCYSPHPRYAAHHGYVLRQARSQDR